MKEGRRQRSGPAFRLRALSLVTGGLERSERRFLLLSITVRQALEATKAREGRGGRGGKREGVQPSVQRPALRFPVARIFDRETEK